MKLDIQEASGNEVFWVGKINSEGKIVSAVVGSRGNIDSVIVNRNLAREGHVLIHNHPSGDIHPSEADQGIAANATDTSLGFYIVNNDVSDVYAVVEPVKPKVTVKLNEDNCAFFLSKDGPLAEDNKFYEERPSQISLLRNIVQVFNGDRIGVFEAGTGVGKSFAYLIPSLLWADKNNERVVISTGTINLQQQLMEKDIPLAQKIISREVKSILLKGRQNYVCLRRLDEAAKERDLFDENVEFLDKIEKWARTSDTGSRSDLSFMPPESVWSRVNSESDGCLGMRCRNREKCFVMKVRKEAADSRIIVVNHHLLFADIESRMGGAGYEDTAVLPPYRRIVFDEAHGIEDSATSFFSESVTRFKVVKQLNLLHRTFRNSVAGLVAQLSVVSNFENLMEKVVIAVGDVKENLVLLDDAARLCMENEFTARIDGQSCALYAPVFEAAEVLKKAIATLTGILRQALDLVDEDDKEIPCVFETKSVTRRLEDVSVLLKNFCEWNEFEDKVFWMQRVRIPPKRQGDEALEFVQFTQTPLDIAPLMNEGVFEPMGSVVCVSATLRTGTNFGYWMRRTGLSFVGEERLVQGVFESPFPYRKNVLFAVPGDAPFPDSKSFQSYVEETVLKLVRACGGRTLVLFTSHESLRSTFRGTAAGISGMGFRLYKQGDDDRFRLLEKFRDDRESVLYATDSFWEGVDVPGDSLSQVIIIKLPFAVPNDPVFAARSESVEKRGGSSFMELSVPQAVIKFRQGFGRLMRRSDDRGAIIVLDRRIVEKQYGKTFTSCVPMTRRMYNPLSDIVKAVEDWVKQ